jgi:hypothetical protein
MLDAVRSHVLGLPVEVPVAPAVYRRLRSQAEAGGQTPAQLMGSILTAAAGKEEFT